MKHLFFPLLLITFALGGCNNEKKPVHSFELGHSQFLLDGKPFQMISGEMHPARIPREYWRHRIQMAKAMGCNTIAAYIFWNYQEPGEGVFDFKTGNHDITAFLDICKDEGLWVLWRPGPYVCAEWEFGGIPPYLLRYPDLKVRCMDPRYFDAAKRYLTKMAQLIKPYYVTNGGPILMVQIENEYGSYGNDKNYLEALRQVWLDNGCTVPFYTADGATSYMLEAGNIDGAAIGLDPGYSEAAFMQATKRNPDVPAFSSETYPGWLTHWGESWARPDTAGLYRQIRFLMNTKRSFNFYVVHGGTNFGFTAGANSGGKGYQPDVTSYDYDAPIDEQGRPTYKYFGIRKILSEYLGKLPEIPDSVPAMEIPEIEMKLYTSLWDNLSEPVWSVQPKPFEAYGQDYGFILYKTKLIGRKKGRLVITELHDYATIFLNGKYLGHLDRREGENSIMIPASEIKNPVLEILVEGMGRINFAQHMIDRKGITDRVTLNGMTLMNWDVYKLPFDKDFINHLQPTDKELPVSNRPGRFFKGTFDLSEVADTYINVSNYQKGLVWVNGHNLGRYWDIGPQYRLYCPAPFLKKGKNEVLIFDLLQIEAKTVRGVEGLGE